MQDASAPLTPAVPSFGHPPLDDALAAGLLLESGIAAAAWAEVRPGGAFSRWALPSGVSKRGVLLTPDELTRQLTLIGWFIDNQRYSQAVDGLRAWMVNLIMQRLPWDIPRWLARDERAPIERYLDSLAYRARLGLDDPSERPLAAVWTQVRGLQSALQDGGLTPDDVVIDRAGLYALHDACVQMNLEGDLEPSYLASDGRLVITPLGLAPGVLYAVARLLTPSHVLIVTSEQGREREGEALARAGFPYLRRTVRVCRDPFDCFADAGRLANDAELRDLMMRHDEVVVNITGGTTAMQYVIERLWRESRALGKRTAMVALIDRRSPAEQMVQPYVEGELAWLDPREQEVGA